MRRILLNLSLTALAIATPVAAHAGSLEAITFTSTSGTLSYKYLVPPTPTSFKPDASGFIELSGVSVITTNGATTTTSSDTVDFLTSVAGGGLYDSSTGGDSFSKAITALTGVALFNGSLTAPSFASLTDTGFTDNNNILFNVTIAPASTPLSTTPEPSSLMLLGTGGLGLLGAMRRKLFA